MVFLILCMIRKLKFSRPYKKLSCIRNNIGKIRLGLVGLWRVIGTLPFFLFIEKLKLGK